MKRLLEKRERDEEREGERDTHTHTHTHTHLSVLWSCGFFGCEQSHGCERNNALALPPMPNEDAIYTLHCCSRCGVGKYHCHGCRCKARCGMRLAWIIELINRGLGLLSLLSNEAGSWPHCYESIVCKEACRVLVMSFSWNGNQIPSVKARNLVYFSVDPSGGP